MNLLESKSPDRCVLVESIPTPPDGRDLHLLTCSVLIRTSLLLTRVPVRACVVSRTHFVYALYSTPRVHTCGPCSTGVVDLTFVDIPTLSRAT